MKEAVKRKIRWGKKLHKQNTD